MGSGQFQPDDLSWHQGVSGWVKLKELPEWSQINKVPLPSLAPEKQLLVNEPKQTDSSIKSLSNKTKKIQPKTTSTKITKTSAVFEEASNPAKTGMGTFGKLMVAVAITIFLSTFAVVGLLVYKNIDKFMPPEEVPSVSLPVTEEPDEIEEPDPFAPPQQD